jgi:hypothetical protein
MTPIVVVVYLLVNLVEGVLMVFFGLFMASLMLGGDRDALLENDHKDKNRA